MAQSDESTDLNRILPRALLSLRRAVIWRQQPVSQQIVRGACPGLVGIAAHVGAHRRDQLAGMHVVQVDIDVEDEIGDFLNRAGDDEISTDLPRQLHFAAAAGLQIAAVRRSIDRRSIQNGELAGVGQHFPDLVACTHEPPLLIGTRTIDFALKAGIDEFEIEDGNLW